MLKKLYFQMIFRFKKGELMLMLKKKPRSKKERMMSILYAIVAIFCFINYRPLLLFGLILSALAVANFILSNKHSANEQKIEGFLNKINEEEQDEDMRIDVSKVLSKENKKKRKQEYDDYLAKIEDELGDFDCEEDEDDEI